MPFYKKMKNKMKNGEIVISYRIPIECLENILLKHEIVEVKTVLDFPITSYLLNNQALLFVQEKGGLVDLFLNKNDYDRLYDNYSLTFKQRYYVNIFCLKIQFYELSRIHAEWLIIEKGGQLIEEYKNKIVQIFELNHRKALLCRHAGPSYYLFNNLQELLDYDIRKSHSIARGLNPYGIEFVSNIPKVIKKLSNDLKVELSILDKSINSLGQIDRIIGQIEMNDYLYLDLILGLTAYVGEVFIQNKGGQWEMEKHDNGETYMPSIRSEKENLIPFMVYIYEEFHPDAEFSGSLLSIYSRFKRK